MDNAEIQRHIEELVAKSIASGRTKPAAVTPRPTGRDWQS